MGKTETTLADFALNFPTDNIPADVRATVIGSGLRTSPQNAALANGFLGHFEDYDDTHTTVIHPSAPPIRWWRRCVTASTSTRIRPCRAAPRP
ncbi:MAG: MmgE/PrpD family protein [Deltaproteobacteria bacterium]|nr:MmgE/PrpD family protein [Deltaproteobacteria bacterium]